MSAYALRFTEEMKGWFGFAEPDCRRGEEAGRRAGSSLMFHLTIASDDLDRFIDDPSHVAAASGWVRSDVLGGTLPVTDGVFNLFVTESPHARRMLYRLHFPDGVGRPLTLSGFKDIKPGAVTEVWPETSTLYTTVLRGRVEEGQDAEAPLVGRGILHIRPLDFARQLTTFRVRGGTALGDLRALARFGDLFAGQLWEVFAARASGRHERRERV